MYVGFRMCACKTSTKISSILEIPTIGIGSGKYCDGQVLVYHDLLGLNKDFKAKFVKHFDKIDPQVGVEKYRDEVKSGIFLPKSTALII